MQDFTFRNLEDWWVQTCHVEGTITAITEKKSFLIVGAFTGGALLAVVTHPVVRTHFIKDATVSDLDAPEVARAMAFSTRDSLGAWNPSATPVFGLDPDPTIEFKGSHWRNSCIAEEAQV